MLKRTLLLLLPLLLASPLGAQQEPPRVVETERLVCQPNEWSSPQEALGAALAWQESTNMITSFARVTFSDVRLNDRFVAIYNSLVLTGLIHGVEANAVYLIAEGNRTLLFELLNRVNTRVFPPLNYTFTIRHAERAFETCYLRETRTDGNM